MGLARFHTRIAAPSAGARSHRRRGFTLIEAAMATVIIGLGVVAVVELIAAGTVSNVRGTEMTTGMNLARNIRERLVQAPYASIPGFNGSSYAPPVDSRGQAIAGMDGWQQQIAVQTVDPNRLTLAITDPSPQALHVTAAVSRNGRKVCDLSWFSFDGTP